MKPTNRVDQVVLEARRAAERRDLSYREQVQADIDRLNPAMREYKR